MNIKEIRSWANSCLRKKRYKSMQQAEDIINKISKRRSTKLRVYLCPKCLGYHLTKVPLKTKEVKNGK
ncbi:MAG: hypothetical protein NC222_06350 [Staphylococcus sp.]|nr:hypothetical protein [Staphylococcus sp.]